MLEEGYAEVVNPELTQDPKCSRQGAMCQIHPWKLQNLPAHLFLF